MDAKELDTMYHAYIAYAGREKMKRIHPSREEFQQIMEFIPIFGAALDVLGGANEAKSN